MKKLTHLALVCGLAFPLAGQAHDLWAYAQQAEAGKDLLAVLGYGDRFP
ncbi:hypothetical protein [Avibacterium endocarditidis]|nr:hypothetical protein [Avibacterium endocarditidis]